MARESTGIYQIKNLINGKFYIGSAAGKGGFKERWRKHRETGQRGEHRNPYFQFAWDKYGLDAFVFEIIEECEPGECIEREQHYMDILLFASCNDKRFKQLGYNLCRVAGSTLGIKFSDKARANMSISRMGREHSVETKLKMSKAQRGEKGSGAKLTNSKVLEIIDLIKEGDNNQEIGEKFNVGITCISSLRHGKTWSHITGFSPNSFIKNKRPIATEATRIKISKNSKGRKHTEETKEKMRIGKQGENNPYAKLNILDVKEIRLLLQQRLKQKDIAKQFKISTATVCNIKVGKIWRHV